MVRGGATTFDLSDRLGTASRQTNSATTTTRTYDAFGMALASTGTPLGPFGFAGASGYQEDGDSGLKLLGHRYYDSSTGRFLTRDRIKDGRNWYGYCENGPLGLVDADGLRPGDKFRTPDLAAKDAANTFGGRAGNKKHVEHGGWIYRNDDGTYSYTDETDRSKRESDGLTRPKPPGNGVGGWHTHPNPTGTPLPGRPGWHYVADKPSGFDTDGAEARGNPEYYSSPTTIWRYSPQQGKYKPIGKI